MHDNRTIRAKITNHAQVVDSLDQHGWSASKLWNVGLYYLRHEWEETGEIPDEDELKSELKTHYNYNGLHSQSSQNVLEELSDAFSSWYSSSDPRDNPPGYRKRNYYDAEGNRVHEEHPRSTITWKQQGIRHDTKHGQIRLSKGKTTNPRNTPASTSLSSMEHGAISISRTCSKCARCISPRSTGGNSTSSANTK